MSPVREELRQVLEDARAAGFLGPGPVEAHLQHAQGFAEAAEAALGHSPAHFVDLGTGGGIPGLVLGARWSRSRGVFIESNRRRCAALRDAVVRLGLENRVEVLEQRAEAAGRQGTYRGRLDSGRPSSSNALRPTSWSCARAELRPTGSRGRSGARPSDRGGDVSRGTCSC